MEPMIIKNTQFEEVLPINSGAAQSTETSELGLEPDKGPLEPEKARGPEDSDPLFT